MSIGNDPLSDAPVLWLASQQDPQPSPAPGNPLPTCILIADGSAPIRRILHFIGATLDVVGLVPDVATALQLRPNPPADLCVLVVTGEDGLPDAVRTLSTAQLAVHLVVVTTAGEPLDESLISVITSGADGYFSTGLEPAVLLRSLNAVAAGEPGISRRQVATVIAALRQMAVRDGNREDDRTAGLTAREQQILQELLTKASTKEIAIRLAVSEGTVRWHTARLLKKLNVTSRDELAAVRARSPLPTVARSATTQHGAESASPQVRYPDSAVEKINWGRLAPSELRIIRFVAVGLTNRQIADRLFLSKHTVDSHLKNAFAKLQVRSRVELTRLLLANEPESLTG